MNNAHKWLVIKKRGDWAFSRARNIHRDAGRITLEEGVTDGYFYLKPIDSGANGFVWGRVSLDCEIPENSAIRTSAYASDFNRFGGLDKEFGTEDEELFVHVGGGRDFYLNLSGRYLWLKFEFIASGEPPWIEALRLNLSGDHMTDYLPEIYRKDGDFTKRFLSVFDSMYMDMERSIYELPSRFDYEAVDGDQLKYLAMWMGVNADELDSDTARERIRSAFDDYEDMHTVRGVRRSVKRLCGREAQIIESADVDPNRPDCVNSELYRRLYGENPYKFFILLEEDSFPSRARMEWFIKEMRGLIPANTELELVLLKRCVQLDRHTYLGVNSMVSDYAAVVIDENSTIHYDTTIGGDEGEGH